MRKFCTILLLALATSLLAGCGSDGYSEDYSAYQHMTSKQLIQGAEASMADENYADAVKQLEAMDAMYPFGAYAKQAQLDSIYAYYKNDDAVSALVAADRFQRLYPRDSRVDYALYMKGVVNFNQDMTWLQKMMGTDPAPRDLTHLQESFSDFNQVLSRFPKSPYAADAAIRMIYIRDIIARHEMQVANYYYIRKAYLAAANRANFVIEHFQGSPQVLDAVRMNIKAYRALNMPKRVALYQHILSLNIALAKSA